MASIGENIKRLREANGLSQAELASRVGKTRTAIWQYEHDETIPRMGVIEDMARVFGVPKGEIIENKDGYMVIEFHSDDEYELLSLYRSLSKKAKRALLAGLRDYASK